MGRPKIYDESLRRQLIALAAQAIAQGGPDALSLRRLASTAETSTTAIYTIFGSKDDLVAAVLEAASASLTAAQDAVPATDDPLADFAELGRAYRRWALEQPALYDVMFGRSGLREVIAGTALDVAMRPLLDAVRRCIAAGRPARRRPARGGDLDLVLGARPGQPGDRGLPRRRPAGARGAPPRHGDVWLPAGG